MSSDEQSMADIPPNLPTSVPLPDGADEQVEEDKKRKLDEMESEVEDVGVETPSDDGDALENKKVKVMGSPDAAATTGLSTSTTPAPDTPEVISLTAGQIYRIKSFDLGDFHFRAGDMPTFHVVGTPVTISDLSRNVIFSGGTLVDRVEVRDDVQAGTTTVTLIPGNTKSGTDEEKEESFTSPLRIVAVQHVDILIGGARPALLTGNSRAVSYDGTGELIIKGNVYELRNFGTGTVKMTGNVESGTVEQAGEGSIFIEGDLAGGGIMTNINGGTLEFTGNVLGHTVARGNVLIKT